MSDFLQLAVRTVTDPRQVARDMLARNLDPGTVGMVAVLGLTLHALFLTAAAVTQTLPPMLMEVVTQPLILILMMGSMFAILSVSLTWTGRALGGAGRLIDVVLLLGWLQILRAVAEALDLLLRPIAPGLSILLTLATAAAELWILANFIAEAHGIVSLGRAALVLILAVTGLVLGLSLFLSLIGVTSMGLPTNV